MTPAPSMITASSSSTPVRWTRTRCDQRGREVLADEVGADRQLAVAAVDQHGELDGARPADVVQGVERGPDRAPGEEHVVDEHHDLVVDAAVGDLRSGSSVRAGLRRRSSRYIVTSSEPDGTAPPSTAAIRSAIRSASGTPRDGIPSRTRSAAPLLRSRISWEMRLRAREMSPASRTVRPVSSAARSAATTRGWQAQPSAAGPPSPPHGTAR